MDKERKTRACLMPSCHGKRFDLVHKFPMDNERAEMWRTIINVPNLFNYSIEHLRKRMFLCSKHFRPKDYKNIESRSLNKTAMPSLYLNDSSPGEHTAESVLPPNASPRLVITTAAAPTTTTTTSNLTVSVDRSIQCVSSGWKAKPKRKRAGLVRKPIVTNHVPIPIENGVKDATGSGLDCSPSKIKFRLINAATEPSIMQHCDSDLVSIVPMSNENYILLQSEPFQTQQSVSSPTSTTVTSTISIDATSKTTTTTTTAAEHQRFFIDDGSFIKQHIESMIVIPCETVDHELLPQPQDYLTCASDFVEIVSSELTAPLKLSTIWLRDQCRCFHCYNQKANKRKCSILDIPLDLGLHKYTLNCNELCIIWNDNHESTYGISQLHAQQSNAVLNRNLAQDMLLWGRCEIENSNWAHVNLTDLLCDENQAKAVVMSLTKFGVAFIEMVPANTEFTEIAVKRLFDIHKTCFGKMWSTANRKHPDDDQLTAHTASSYFNDAAGVQVLHCVQHSGNGDNVLIVDGFKAVGDLKAKHAAAYDRLCRTLVPFEHCSKDSGKIYSNRAPIIQLDAQTGRPEQIRFNLSEFGVMNTLPQSEMLQFYTDVRLLAAEIRRSDNEWWFQLRPGTVLMLDNWRLLHGRAAFTGQRNIVGCFVSRTEFMSVARTMGIIS